jgi:hypothetical protein
MQRALFWTLSSWLLGCPEAADDEQDVPDSPDFVEATDEGTVDEGTADDAAAGDTPTPDATEDDGGADGEDAVADEGGAEDGGGDVVPPEALAVNEIRAAGDDWIELYNAGDEPVALEGWRIADGNADGTPRLAEAVAFPAGATLEPGAFLFVLADLGGDALPGWQTACLEPAVPQCLHVAWGISRADGDTITVLDAADGVVTQAVYPPDAVPDGQTWGRLPDGTGDFAPNAPTPFAVNRAPD